MKILNKFVKKYATDLTDNEIKYITNFEYKTSNLYCLPKIHKSEDIAEQIRIQQSELVTVTGPPDLKMRPIVAGPTCPTHRLSHLLDLILRPLVKKVKANVRDTSDILSRLPERLEEGHKLATFDIENLYGNITHTTGLDAINFWLQEVAQDDIRISNNFILEGLKLILENNIFYFNGRFFRQLRGTAMGTKVAPVYATLTLGYLERSLCNSLQYPVLSTMFMNNYFRYLDDILIIYDEHLTDTNSLSKLLNNLNSDFRFTLESSGLTVNFLDVKIITENGYLKTDIFYKSTDSKQYLNFHSHHPRHIKIALPYNLSRRICTIVSDNDLRKTRLNEMKNSLLKCNYPLNLINDGIKKALSINRDDLLNPVKKENLNKNNSIIHVSTFSTNYCNNDPLIRNYFNLLKNNVTTKQFYENKNLILAKRQPPNLKGVLTQAKLEGGESGGVFKCNNSRCKLCNIIVVGSSLMFRPTNYNFKIKCSMTCNTLNCIYVIVCQGCTKMYIGETNNLRLRTNLHRDHASKNIGLDVSRHIYSCSLDNSLKFKIMPFYKMQTDDTALRKKMEGYFIEKFKPELNQYD